MRLPNGNHAWLIARITIIRQWRSIRGTTARFAVIVVMAMIAALFICGAVLGAYLLGTGLRTGSITLSIRDARVVAIGLSLFVAYWAGMRVLQTTGTIDHAAGILTTVPYHDAVAGLVLSEFVLYFGAGILPIAAFAAAFALGASSLASFVAIGVALIALVALALLIGYVVGQFVELGFARSSLFARYKTAIGALVVVAYFLFVTTSIGTVFALPLDAIGTLPLGWFADLALVFAPGVAVAWPRIIGAIVTVGVGVPVLASLSMRLAGWLWYTDPVQVEADEAPPPTGKTRFSASIVRGLWGIVSRPTLSVAQKNWLRAQRAPIKLSYMLYPAFFLIAPVQQAVLTGTIPATLPVLVAGYLAWGTGAAFALNPLGDEGVVLPVTLTAVPSGRRLIRGTILSGIVLGIPLIVVATVVLGVFSSLSLLGIGGTLVSGVVLCVGSAALATGMGTALPKFETSQVSLSREAVIPSVWAFVVFSVALFVLSIPGLLVQIPVLAELLASALDTSRPVITVAGALLTALLVAVVGWVSYRYATRTIEAYTP